MTKNQKKCIEICLLNFRQIVTIICVFERFNKILKIAEKCLVTSSPEYSLYIAECGCQCCQCSRTSEIPNARVGLKCTYSLCCWSSLTKFCGKQNRLLTSHERIFGNTISSCDYVSLGYFGVVISLKDLGTKLSVYVLWISLQSSRVLGWGICIYLYWGVLINAYQKINTNKCVVSVL